MSADIIPPCEKFVFAIFQIAKNGKLFCSFQIKKCANFIFEKFWSIQKEKVMCYDLSNVVLRLDAGKIAEKVSKKVFGIETYLQIMGNVNPQNDEFQRVFNWFYRINAAHRDDDWKRAYYDVFAEFLKNKNANFPEILGELQKSTGNVEFSFASKMAHTIDNSKPIVDSRVLQFFGYGNHQWTLDRANAFYAALERWYENYLKTDSAEECIDFFDRIAPGAQGISPVKKIDFLIWAGA